MAERLSAREAVALVTGGSPFTELTVPEREFKPDGPLEWQGYDASRARAAARTGEAESVVCGHATVGETPAVIVSFEFGFLGGSLGVRTGDRLEAAYTHAREHRLPVVSLVATGGSRMQEGMLALTQLQRVARQSALTREAGLPQLAVVQDPTTGGGWATLGAGADVILALPGAQIGFAGSRVRPADADPAAYTAEAQLAAGAVDAVVRPEDLGETLALWLTLLTRPATAPAPVPPALPSTDSDAGSGPASASEHVSASAAAESGSGSGSGSAAAESGSGPAPASKHVPASAAAESGSGSASGSGSGSAAAESGSGPAPASEHVSASAAAESRSESGSGSGSGSASG
ncbi:MAG: acyl-CoA carboxylase subunit beta, partial [Streptomyces sp.]|nr:acyl-CoA carboxylase subunit beta [Streptomyces sp.]